MLHFQIGELVFEPQLAFISILFVASGELWSWIIVRFLGEMWMTVWIVFHRSSLASLSRVLSSKHLLRVDETLAKLDRRR